MSELNIDQLIEDVVKAEIKNSPAPALSTAEAWEQLNQRLQDRRAVNQQRKGRYRSRGLLLACAAVVLLAVLWNPVNSSAFGKLTEIFQQVQGAFIELFVRVDAPYEDENAPDNYAIVNELRVRSETMSLEEAQKNTSFDIKVPSYIPDGFQLESVIVIQKDNQISEEIYLQYKNNNRSLVIGEKIIRDFKGTTVVADYEDTIREEITVNNHLANLFTYKDGTLELIWVVDDYNYFEITGILPKDEIIAIAESIQ